MLHTKFRENRFTGSGEKEISMFFCHIWAWWPSWSCDTDAVSILLLALPMEIPQIISLEWPSDFREKDV